MSKENLAAPVPIGDPDPIEKFTKQARDLDALRKTVEDAAAVSAGFWLSYLFVLFYIGIAAGAVTHKDLLLENPVKLPFLSDVPLPLIAFFFLAPIIFIVAHAYTLLHFVMLAMRRKRGKVCGGNCRAIFSCNFSPDRATYAKASWGSS